MKRLILVISISILSSGLAYFIYEMYGFTKGVKLDTEKKFNWQIRNTAVYFVDLPEGLDTLSFEANITLDKLKQIHKIKFPNGGTETTVLIYDKDHLESTKHKPIIKVESLASGSFKYDEEVLIDVSHLKYGQYYVHYISCNLGGIFLLKIN